MWLLIAWAAASANQPAPGSASVAIEPEPRGGSPAQPLRQAVEVSDVEIDGPEASLTVTLYRPRAFQRHAPAIVFLPGLMAPVDQYDSYARALAAEGFLVAAHEWYSPLTSDVELAREARVMADWLVDALRADPARIGIAGHSMGGKDAILAAAAHGGFSSVVAIDPDDAGELSVVHGQIAALRAPLLLIGAEVAWKAASICAPMETNYLRFFEQAPAGTVELTLRGADHVQMLDEPDRFGYGICRVGMVDSRRVHDTALSATVGFFAQHMMGGPVLTTLPEVQGVIRVAQTQRSPGSSGTPARL
jgi:dienelactone hydrolase